MYRFLREVLSFVTIVFLLNQLMGAYLRSYETQDLVKAELQFNGLAWQEFYEQKNIDVLILGSSHAYRSYNPMVIESILASENTVFNLGSPAQTPRTSYYALEEVLANTTLKLLVLDLYFMVCTSDEQLKNGRVVYQSMLPGKGRSALFQKGFNFEEKCLLKMFPSYVYRGRLKSKLKSTLGLSHLPTHEGYYVAQGFATRDDTIAIESIRSDNQFDYFSISKSDLTSTNLHYIQRIIELCEARNVKIVFMSAPMPEITVNKVEKYDELYQLFRQVAVKHKITYIDYNVNRVLSLEDRSHYYNDDHLNQAGAQLFSVQVAKDIDQSLAGSSSN